MVHKCCVYGCKSNYDSIETMKMAVFGFPSGEKFPVLQKLWIRFVNRADWEPSHHARICDLHFEEKFFSEGKQRKRLIWKQNPVPTIHAGEVETMPSLKPTPITIRKPPVTRVFQKDQLVDFTNAYSIPSFDELCAKSFDLEGFSVMKNDQAIVYYNVHFDEETDIPKILECIKVDRDLRILLQYSGNPIPLPPWLVHSRNGKLNLIA